MDEQSEVVQRALGYPYAIPQRSFVQVGGRTLPAGEVEVDLSERTPVLAYGANAAPEALARKLAADPDPVPLMRATLSGYDVVYSAHISPYGSVPAALLPSAGTEVDVFVSHFTARQLALVSASEPNYELRTIEAGRCLCEEAPATELSAYMSRHGSLRVDGSAVALAAFPARGRRLPAMGQREVLERLRAALSPDRDFAGFVADCAAGKVSLRDLA
jgi:hypothetical protein